jgi:transcriptional regulator with XRE-family HTH domain
MPRPASRSGSSEADPGHPTGIDVESLRRLVRDRRGTLSIRQAAADAGVSFSTLSRVEAGAQPDLATFLQLCAWLGEPPELFFRSNARRTSDTIDQVTSHLIADPRLSPEAAERIVSVVRDLYDALARDVQDPPPLAVHLRAATALRPGVPERLASLLHDVHHALEQRQRESSL